MNKLALLYNQDKNLFHTADLANVWGMENKNSVKVAAKRMVDRGLLKRIYRGMYALKEYSPVELGFYAINSYCYLSLESVLFEEGYISQRPHGYSFVARASKRIEANSQLFRYRKMKEGFLYNDFGVEKIDGVLKANAYRAIADLLYYNPLQYFDRDVDFDKVREVQKVVGYPLTERK